jgi:hypothetical protein
MKTSRQISVPIVLLLVTATMTMTGCGTMRMSTTDVSSDLQFERRSNQIPVDVGLYVRDEARAYTASANYAFQKYTLPIGESLEPNARRSLSQVFRSVQVVGDPVSAGAPNSRFPVTLSLGVAGADIELGTFNFSEQKVNVSIHCKAYAADGKTLFETTSAADGVGRDNWGFIPGNTNAFQVGLQRAGEDGLRKALERLNDDLSERGGLLTAAGSVKK